MKKILICVSLLALWSESAVSVTFENQTKEDVQFTQRSKPIVEQPFVLKKEGTVEKDLLSALQAKQDYLEKHHLNVRGLVGFNIKANVKGKVLEGLCDLKFDRDATSDVLYELNKTHFIIKIASGTYGPILSCEPS